MYIHVIQEDINKAQRHRKDGCPSGIYRAYSDCAIACALQREQKTWRVGVDGAYVFVTIEGVTIPVHPGHESFHGEV